MSDQPFQAISSQAQHNLKAAGITASSENLPHQKWQR
jgi:hypothetical protein